MGSHVEDAWDDPYFPDIDYEHSGYYYEKYVGLDKYDQQGRRVNAKTGRTYNLQKRQPSLAEATGRAAQRQELASILLEAGETMEWREVPQAEVPVTQELVLSKGKGLSMSTVEDDLRKALVKFASVQALVGRFGGQQPPTGSVLRWTVDNTATGTGEMILQDMSLAREARFQLKAPRSTTFIAVRNDKTWHVTGTRNNAEVSWDELVKLIDNSPCQLVSEWVEVPAPEKPAEEMMDPVKWAAMMFKKEDGGNVTDGEVVDSPAS